MTDDPLHKEGIEAEDLMFEQVASTQPAGAEADTGAADDRLGSDLNSPVLQVKIPKLYQRLAVFFALRFHYL